MATNNAVADLLNTVLDIAYHPTRYGRDAMALERQQRVNQIQQLQAQGEQQTNAINNARLRTLADRYTSTIEQNLQSYLAGGGSVDDFYIKQRDAIFADPYFRGLPEEARRNVLSNLRTRATQTAGMLGQTLSADKADNILMQYAGIPLPKKSEAPSYQTQPIEMPMPTTVTAQHQQPQIIEPIVYQQQPIQQQNTLQLGQPTQQQQQAFIPYKPEQQPTQQHTIQFGQPTMQPTIAPVQPIQQQPIQRWTPYPQAQFRLNAIPFEQQEPVIKIPNR